MPESINPPTMRARLMLEVAAELATSKPFRHVAIRFTDASTPLVFSSSSTPEGIAAVVSGSVSFATINPSAALTIAYRGNGPFASPQPVNTIAVMPSLDRLVLAMHPRTGIRSLQDLATSSGPMIILVRGEAAHALHFILDDVLAASGAPRAALEARGIRFERRGGIPVIDRPKFDALLAGEVDGIFDEGADEWLDEALSAGMRVFGVSEVAVMQLEALGYRRAILEKKRYGGLERDLLTLDFSGWALFVHSAASDDLVTNVCRALDARKATIPWEQGGPLPIERMCRNTVDAPFDVPLHPAARRFWSARGYLVAV
jgi:TRAP-type uncharacterized transport system substrate-binding protein